MTTVQDKTSPPLLVVRTRVTRMPVEDLLDALVGAILDHPSMANLRDEQLFSEPVLEMKPAADLAEAQQVVKAMVAEHPEIPERQRVKIVAQPSERYLATQAIDDALYIGGVKCCPECKENFGSDLCRCNPAILFDMRAGAR